MTGIQRPHQPNHRHRPEALQDWLAQLRQQHPQARVAICLEQPAANLVAFLESYTWITLYAINPVTLKNFREAFVTSRAKDDTKDADYLAELLLTHHDKLTVWAPEDSATRPLQQAVTHRRAVVDERTGLTNRLNALLKAYFPQAFVLSGEELWRPMATELLLKWPTLRRAKKSNRRPSYNSTASTFPQRYAAGATAPMLSQAMAVTEETALVETFALRVQLIARQLQLLHRPFTETGRSPRHTGASGLGIFASFPGAGPVLGRGC